VAQGTFRAGLFYRGNVFPIHLPPLRERPEDIVLLAHYFAQQFRARLKKKISAIDQRSLERLQRYPWPGNVWELAHIIERAVLLADGEMLRVDWPLGPGEPASGRGHKGGTPQPLTTLQDMERTYIAEVLRHAGGRIAGTGGAANILGLPASTLLHRLKKLSLQIIC
jgi:transcriptional regulator with GAF, ATPase, and Fis domain